MSQFFSSRSPFPIAYALLLLSAVFAVVRNDDRSCFHTDNYHILAPARIESVLAQIPDHLAEFRDAGASGVFLDVAFSEPRVYNRHASLQYDNLVLLRLKSFRLNPLSHSESLLLFQQSHRWHCSPDEFPARAA